MVVYRSILVPVDGSMLAQQALAVASTLAARLPSSLHVVHVHHERVVDEFPMYGLSGDAARAAAEQYVAAVADRLRPAGAAEVVATVLEGSPAAAITEYAARAGIDLIVMSSHGRTGASRFWLGSVADAVIRTATVPVLMVRATGDEVGAPGIFERILVPLDGSSRAESVIPHAIAMARTNSSHVHLLSVEERTEDLRLSVWALASVEPDDLPARLARADRYLHSVKGRFQSESLPPTISVEARGGHRIGETITQVAVEQNTDLIAMATHGRGASRLFVGSVADKVIRGSACSILLVRAR